ncbi:MAG: hypothetical protein EBV10_12290 [Synechococcaceae bacterium WB6_1A_059]|nr:hypothetical protein [Synechococcaceae bacterium WB6_1A_059]
MVKIEGLTKNQKIIAEFMWNQCDTQRDVEAVLELYGRDARTVYELLTATALDEYMAVDEARVILQRFQ